MADFVPAGFGNDIEEEEEEDETEVDAFDFSFFPVFHTEEKEEEKKMIPWPNPFVKITSVDSAVATDEAS